MSERVRTDYLGSVFDPSRFGHTVKRALELGKKVLEKEQFDSIAFTGTSGAAMAFILAAELKVALICIRKETDNSHYMAGSGRLEGYTAAKRYLFVDDFICSGTTYRGVLDYLKKAMPNTKCVGALMYGRVRSETSYFDLPLYCAQEGSDGAQLDFKNFCWNKLGGENAYRW